MAVVLKLKPWVVINNLSHVSTSWQIASDINFNGVIDSLLQSTDNLLYWTSTTNVVPGIPYYSRVKRYFNDGSDSGWGTPIKIIDPTIATPINEIGNVSIDRPIVYIDSDSINQSQTSLILGTEAFNGVNATHTATHWIIVNGDNDVVFESLNDTSNLTYIYIDKIANKLLEQNILIVYVIHVGSGLESKPGITSLTIGEFNFNIITDTKRVLPNNDLDVIISKIDSTKPTYITTVSLIDPVGNAVVYSNNFTSEQTTYIIPGDLMLPNSNYYLDFYINNNGIYNTMRRLITTVSGFLNVKDYNRSYNKTYTESLLTNPLTVNTPVNKFTSSMELPNGDIVLPSLDNSGLSMYKLDRTLNQLKLNTNISLNSIKLNYTDNASPIDNSSFMFKVTPNNYCLVDSLYTNGTSTYPILNVFKYNPTLSTFTLNDFSFSRLDESKALGYTNSYVFDSDTTFIYIPYGSNVIKRFDFVNQTLTSVVTAPLHSTAFNYIFKINSDLYAVFGSDISIAYYYQPSTGLFSNGFSIPAIFLGRHLRQFNLLNGDVAFFIAESTGDNYYGIFYYSRTDNQVTTLNGAVSEVWYPDSSVQLATGEILFLKAGEVYSKYGMYE